MYTPDAFRSACLLCDAGTFGSSDGATLCELCGLGTFASWLGMSSCDNCTAGTYASARGSAECLACPNGTFATRLGMTTLGECGSCKAGQFLRSTSTTCLDCSAGTYSQAGATVCTACPSNSESPIGAVLADCRCLAGFSSVWVAQGLEECVPCQRGTYSRTLNASACTDCNPGTYATGVQALSCSLCGPGTFSSGVGVSVCTECQTGFYVALEGMTQCLSCGRGQFGTGTGLAGCQPCQAGEFAGGLGTTQCTLCQPGSFSGGLQATACQSCPAGSFMELVGGTVCTGCPAGSYSMLEGLVNSSLCTPCQSRYYGTSAGMTSAQGCLRCPVGLTSDAGAVACLPCRSGEFPNEAYGSCATCPAHSRPDGNATLPQECQCLAGYRLGFNAKAVGGVESYRDGLIKKVHTYPPGTQDAPFRLLVTAFVEVFCGEVRLSEGFKLEAGTYPVSTTGCDHEVRLMYTVDTVFDALQTETYVQCVPCKAGTYSGPGLYGESCLLCPPKTYQDAPGSSACKPCPTGDPASSGMLVCNPCPGQTVLQDGECRPCPVGTFYPAYLQEPACLKCPANMWSEGDANGCQSCPVSSQSPGGTGLAGCRCNGGLEMRVVQGASYCFQCRKGWYSPPGGNVCQRCPNGTYSVVEGASRCLSCQPNAVSAGGATVCTNCVLGRIPSPDKGTCVPCPAGYYCGLGTVIQCPLGSYSLKTGLTARNQCPACPKNFFCRSPTMIQPCPANTWSPAGSITRHYCACNNGYTCQYFFTTTGNVAITLTPEQLESQRDGLVAALAQAAGVDPSKVKILGVTPG